MAMRAERRDIKELSASPTAAITAERGNESARLVIDAKAISKNYGDRALISNLSLRIRRGDRVGIVGANGSGKTTLLELLLERREPDSGNVRTGENLSLAYVDQRRDILDADVTLKDALTPAGGDQVMVRGVPRHVASYAKEFLFTAEQLRQPVSALSGGERNRLALAIALAKPANLLVLDEPTNDLDMDTLDALEEMLASYDGTVLIVSHDRAFLDGVATQIVGPLGNGKWVETPGGWADFEREHGAVSERRRPRRPTPANAGEGAGAPAAPKKQTKLSYKDERRASELDALMPKLTAEIEALETKLAAPDAFTSADFSKSAARLEAARAERDAAEAEWLEIELLREALNAQE
jgi:ATP-binding cassette subfamily F protein uup